MQKLQLLHDQERRIFYKHRVRQKHNTNVGNPEVFRTRLNPDFYTLFNTLITGAVITPPPFITS